MTKSIFRILMTVLVFAAVYPTLAQAKAIYDNADRVVSDALCVDCADLIHVKKVPNSDLKIYKAKNGGFAIISTSDNSVLAYSTEGDFDPEDMAPALKYMLSNYSKVGVSKICKAQYTPKLLPTAPYHQEAPYNSGIKDGGVVGCVGTALSIILKYHQWPDYGVGTKEYSYYDESGNMITQTYDYSEPFDWSNTLDKYEENGQYTDAQLNAIAALSYASAVAASTIFDSASSMGFMDDALSTLWDNLYYDVASRNWFQVYTTHDDWESSIREQIDEGLPVMYSGGSHAFVVDGYDEKGLFHINWGWGGSGNGYFDLDMLSPSPDTNYSELASALFWLRPRRDKKRTRVTIEAPESCNYSGSIISNRERVLKNQKVRLSNFTVRCYEVPGDLTLGVAMLDKNSNIREIAEALEVSKSDLMLFSAGFNVDLESTFSIDAEEGDYLSIFYKFEGEENWAPADTRAHIENRCPAYDNEVSRVAISWTNEDQFNIRLLWDSDHDSFALNDSWGVIITPKNTNTIFNAKINGETNPDGVIIERSDEEIMININSSTKFREEELNIELISIPLTDIINTSITIPNLEPGTLRTRVAEILDPRVIANLIIKGKMDADDFEFIRNDMLSLSNLDMSDVSIKSDDVVPNDYIVENAFIGMWTMKSILLPFSLKGIGSKAFFRAGIKEISIPSGAVTFGGQVFLWCNNLMKVTIAQNTPPRIGAIFSDGISEATLIVPAGAKEAYAADIYWNQFGNIIEDESVVGSVEDLYAEKTIPFTVVDGYVKSSEKCRVYDCFGRFIGEGNNIALPSIGIYLIVCNGTVKKIAL